MHENIKQTEYNWICSYNHLDFNLELRLKFQGDNNKSTQPRKQRNGLSLSLSLSHTHTQKLFKVLDAASQSLDLNPAELLQRELKFTQDWFCQKETEKPPRQRYAKLVVSFPRNLQAAKLSSAKYKEKFFNNYAKRHILCTKSVTKHSIKTTFCESLRTAVCNSMKE